MNIKIKFDIPYKYKKAQGIYKITNNINRQVYIGRTNNFYKRYKAHCESFKYGYCNSKFCSFIYIHPEVEFKFSLIEITDDLINTEEKYIELYDSVNNGFNILNKDSDVFNLPNWFLNKKQGLKHYRNIKIEKQTCETLRSGYVRLNNGRLQKRPITAKNLLKEIVSNITLSNIKVGNHIEWYTDFIIDCKRYRKRSKNKCVCERFIDKLINEFGLEEYKKANNKILEQF